MAGRVRVRWRTDYWREGEARARARAGSAAGSRAAAETVARRADGLTPWESGHLRASQQIREEGRGASVVYTADYAVPVHEIPPSSGGRWGTGATHAPPTQWKFLERAIHEESASALERMGERLRRAFGRGRF